MDKEFTLWDSIEVKAPMTLAELIDWIQVREERGTVSLTSRRRGRISPMIKVVCLGRDEAGDWNAVLRCLPHLFFLHGQQEENAANEHGVSITDLLA